jgi:ribonuclease H2 subunit C
VAVKRADRAIYKEPKKPQALPIQRVENDEDTNEPEEEPEPVQILTEDGNFDEITVWGHDRVPAVDDSFVKGIGEWIVFAEAVSNSSR